MDSKIGFEMNVIVVEGRGNTWTVCEFHGSNGNGFWDIWWTDNPIYFSSIDMLSSIIMIFYVSLIIL